MLPCFRGLTTALALFATLAVDLRGRQLLEIDAIELRGNAQLILFGGGTCNVLESDTSYEENKQNHGARMDIWRPDFSIHNGSGRWLDHLIARYGIELVDGLRFRRRSATAGIRLRGRGTADGVGGDA